MCSYIWGHVCSITQLRPDLWNSMNCSPPGFSVHIIFQARLLEWVAISSSQGLSNSGIEPESPAWQVDSLLWSHLGSSSYIWKPVFISLLYIPRSRIAGSYNDSLFNFLRRAKQFSIGAEPFYIPTSSVPGFQFLYILSNTCFPFKNYYCRHPSRCEVVSHCSFDLHFCNN